MPQVLQVDRWMIGHVVRTEGSVWWRWTRAREEQQRGSAGAAVV